LCGKYYWGDKIRYVDLIGLLAIIIIIIIIRLMLVSIRLQKSIVLTKFQGSSCDCSNFQPIRQRSASREYMDWATTETAYQLTIKIFPVITDTYNGSTKHWKAAYTAWLVLP
jgi:hypothetical protein